MNFKTTILLFVALLAVGVIFFVSNRSATEQPPQTSQTIPGQGEKLVDLQSNQVTGISITDADGNRTSVRQEGVAWKMTDPAAAPAVDWQTQDLIRTICDLRSQGKPDSTPSDAGLDKPQYTVDLISSDGKSTRLTLGNKTGVGDVMYAQINGGDVNLIDSTLAKTLKTAGDNLRDKHLITSQAADYKQIRVTNPAQTLTLEKQGDRWLITGPTSMPGDSDVIASFISSITGAEATEFVKSDSDELPYARFDHPTLQIWLSTDAPTTQPTADAATQPSGGVTLTIGAPDSLARDHYFAETSDGLIAKIVKTSLDDLTKSPLDLRDRNVVSVTPADVTQISIVKSAYPPLSSAQSTQPSAISANTRPMSTHVVVLARRPKTAAVLGPSPATSQPTTSPTTQATKSAWMFNIPSEPDSAVDDSKMDTLLSKFSPLHADKYLEKAPVEAVDVRFIVTLQTTSTNKYHIEIVKPAGGQSDYAVCNGLVFEIPTAMVDALDTDFHKTP
jgi:Domain of unknown function (DUF4340)